MPDQRPHPLAFPVMLFGNAALAFGPWLVRLADVGPVAVGFWRLLIALPFLWLLARVVRQPAFFPKRSLALLVLGAAVFYAVDLAAWNAGILLTKLGNATLFGNSGSFLFALYGLWLVGRKPSLMQAGALALALVGAVLMMGSSLELSPQHLRGDVLALVAGLFYGGYLVFVERARGGLQALPLLFLATGFAAPMLLVISLAMGEVLWPTNWTPLLVFALSSQVLGQALLVWSIGVFPPLVVGLALLTQPAIATLIGWLVFGETLSLADWLGMIAISAALVLVRLPGRGLRTAAARPS
ncbi:DMT family transporter [Sphingomonas sabuli]|uniref:DMT family transporter n=1 Tax=Sphingomonas sabuli TaxID=2764186 RepID=A0A7G9L0J6_9SPHN|nr:DMT family transporter [Sphingomonas sabuli]QNM82145.1 DMT family transporter [Sphingomonas sabuli]